MKKTACQKLEKSHSAIFRRYSKPLCSLLIVAVYIVSFSLFAQNARAISVTEEIPTIKVPSDYPTIQSAINAASNGDVIFVSPGIYYENLDVNKSIGLLGIDAENTIINGGRKGNVVNITANYVGISGFTIRNSSVVGNSGEKNNGVYSPIGNIAINITGNIITGNEVGLTLHSSGSVISNNEIIANTMGGMTLAAAKNNSITQNRISGSNAFGISLTMGSSNNTLRNNLMAGSKWNFGFHSPSTLRDCFNDIDPSNTVNGKPIYYWVSQSNKTVPSNAGYVALINCTKITVQNLNLANNAQGVRMDYTNDSSILRNNITNCVDAIHGEHSSSNIISGNLAEKNQDGIFLPYSSNNVIEKNTLSSNLEGIYFLRASNNQFYHNSLLNNQIQAASIESENSWDNGIIGNYWCNYTGKDTNQDGIGDTPYIIDANNVDHYPLMGPFHSFDAGEWAGKTYSINIVSNSTILDFRINTTERILAFNASGNNQTSGFSIITIPTVIVQTMWQNNFTIMIDNQPFPLTSWTDAGNTYIYINYSHSEHEITIMASMQQNGADNKDISNKDTSSATTTVQDAIPEFPSTLTLTVFITLISALAIAFGRKHILK